MDWTEGALRDAGIIQIAGTIDDELAEKVIAQILSLNIIGQVPEIKLLVTSEGGSLPHGMAIVDAIKSSKVPVSTVGSGLCLSMGLVVLMSGAKGRRFISERTSLLSHRFSAAAQGNQVDLVALRKEHDNMHELVLNHYMAHTRLKTRKKVEEILLREHDVWLTPEEAITYGIADKILEGGVFVRPRRRKDAR